MACRGGGDRLDFLNLVMIGIKRLLTHGSLEGVGGLKTNEAYHSKADALLIPDM